VVAGSNTVAWYLVHRSVYNAYVNFVFGVMGVRCNACVIYAHINSNMQCPRS